MRHSSTKRDSNGHLFEAVTVCHTTERAVCVTLNKADSVINGGQDLWVPFSVIHDDSEIYDGCEEDDEGDLVVQNWWAGQAGF